MDWERVLLVASHVGVMERLLETCVTYARTRSQFGQSIAKFQAVAHKIADMKVQLEAARLLTYRSAWRLDHARNASLDASITKLFVSESLLKAALDAVHVHGGYGFMAEYEVERALRDAVAATIYSAPRNPAQRHRPLVRLVKALGAREVSNAQPVTPKQRNNGCPIPAWIQHLAGSLKQSARARPERCRGRKMGEVTSNREVLSAGYQRILLC
jgi:hypothetical protein